MSINILIIDRGTGSFDDYPDNCPVCGKSVIPIPIIGYRTNQDVKGETPNFLHQLIFRCPSNQCQSLFIAYYDAYEDLLGCKPIKPVERLFKESINSRSPSFQEIYNQAFKAEQMGWNHVSGPGYRKSLEFLVKDFCSLSVKDEIIESIRRKTLINVIKENIGDEKIRDMAERAAWLGNDETHYIRKWEDKDLQDLKQLIELTVHFIVYKTYLEDMPNGKKG